MLFQLQKGNTAHENDSEQSDLIVLTQTKAVGKTVRPVHPCLFYFIFCFIFYPSPSLWKAEIIKAMVWEND